MRERLVLAVHGQGRVGDIAPRPICVERDRYAVMIGAERIFEESGRADAILGLAALGIDRDRVGIGGSVTGGQRDLAARDRQRLHHQPRGGLP